MHTGTAFCEHSSAHDLLSFLSVKDLTASSLLPEPAAMNSTAICEAGIPRMLAKVFWKALTTLCGTGSLGPMSSTTARVTTSTVCDGLSAEALMELPGAFGGGGEGLHTHQTNELSLLPALMISRSTKPQPVALLLPWHGFVQSAAGLQPCLP